MHGIEAAAEALQHFMVGTALAGRIDQLGADRNVLVTTAVIEVVMFHEHRCRKHDIGHRSCFGHELLMHRDEQIFARKALTHQRLFRRDGHGIGVLDQHRLDGAALQGFGIAGQDAADLGLVEPACGAVDRIVALDDGFVELPDPGIVEESAAAFILPGARHRGDAQRRMHLRRTVAAAGKAVAEAEEGALGLAEQPPGSRPGRGR